MASTYLYKTPSASNRKTWTYSVWFKRSGLTDGGLLVAGTSGGNEGTIRIGSNQIDWQEYNASNTTTEGQLVTNQLLRDTSAWYHLVCTWDSTNATADDRMKMYINGNRVTSLATNNNPPLNYDSEINTNDIHNIGRQSWNSSNYFNGLMSHIHFIDGTAYDASYFGQTDANGVWTIKTSPSVTYGTNGFFILKDGNSVTDQSGNGNNWTVGGTLTNTEDNPSNVFATLNPLDNQMSNFTFANGNTSVTTAQAGYRYARSTLGMTAGKYYFEVKNVSHPANPDGDHYNRIGITDTGVLGSLDQLGKGAYDYSLVEVDGRVENNNTTTAYGVSYSTDGDIVGCALDLDNSKIYWHKNGTWMNSADPSAGTGGYSITPVANTGTGAYFFGVGEGGNNLSSYFNVNFGNGYFGTTAVASAGTNASGNGIFEYDVPTGYTALSTKGLNS